MNRLLTNITCWLSRLACRHDYITKLSKNRVWLECRKCLKETNGIEIESLKTKGRSLS